MVLLVSLQLIFRQTICMAIITDSISMHDGSHVYNL